MPFLEGKAARERCVVVPGAGRPSSHRIRKGVNDSDLARPDLRDIAGASGELFRNLAKVARALSMAHPGPRALVESGPCGRHGSLDVGALRLGNLDEQLLRRRRDDIDQSAARRTDPLAIDEERGWMIERWRT